MNSLPAFIGRVEFDAGDSGDDIDPPRLDADLIDDARLDKCLFVDLTQGGAESLNARYTRLELSSDGWTQMSISPVARG